jgi:NAD kinase
VALPTKLVVVTRKTALEDLVARFNTRDQARFYIEHMGSHFGDYQAAHDAYDHARSFLREALPRDVRSQWVDRSFLPTFTFGASDVVVILGQDGLVVNTAKYLDGQLAIALNPDPERIDGLLLPFSYLDAPRAIALALGDRKVWRAVTMARATLNDGQSLLAVNDLFIGQKTHASARYRIRFGDRAEDQSSSGIIISTGAGSTGWHRSILTGARAIAQVYAGTVNIPEIKNRYRFEWDARCLRFSVREPFISKTSSAEIVYGTIDAQTPLEIISEMPQNGVIFSDGIEEDRVEFNSGAIATVSLAERTLHLLVSDPMRRRS